MKRGEVWIATRFGHDRMVLLVGNDTLTPTRPGVLTVPISDVAEPKHVVEPIVPDAGGARLGVAQVPRVGEVNKEYLKSRAGWLAPESMADVNTALEAALDF